MATSIKQIDDTSGHLAPDAEERERGPILEHNLLTLHRYGIQIGRWADSGDPVGPLEGTSNRLGSFGTSLTASSCENRCSDGQCG
jgi:hypothetical protein